MTQAAQEVPMTKEAGTPLTRFMKKLRDIQAYMDQPELSVYGYVLLRGKNFTSQPLTPEEADYMESADWRRHRKKQCYKNAQLTALTMPPNSQMELRYVEGLVGMNGMELGIHHAWLSLNGSSSTPP